MDCPHCKATVPEGLAFCPSCSHRIPRDLLERSNPNASKETQITRLAGAGAGVVPAIPHSGTTATATTPDGASIATGEATQTGVGPSTAPRIDVSDMIGRRYKLEAMLGRGGMGVVYKARDLDLGEEIAVKLLQPAATKDPQEIDRFKREIVVARRITHPNVIRIHDFGSAGEDSFISMELLTGGTLTRLIEANLLSMEEAVDIAIGICDGLEAAHQAGIIHRDLKPDNVLFDGGGRPKLVDFGLARLAAATTRTIGFSGTPFYMSPEQADGREATTKSDLYSLGVMLYELFTGRLPFVADSLVRLAVMHAQQQPPPPRSVRPDLPAPLETVLLRCLEKDPARRYERAADVAEDLIAWREKRPLVHGASGVATLPDAKSGLSGSFRRPGGARPSIPPPSQPERTAEKQPAGERPSKDPTLILSLRSTNDAPARGAARIGGDAPTVPTESTKSPWLLLSLLGAAVVFVAAIGIVVAPRIFGGGGTKPTPAPTAVALATATPLPMASATVPPSVAATLVHDLVTPAPTATPRPEPTHRMVAIVSTPRPTSRLPMATPAPTPELTPVEVRVGGVPWARIFVDGKYNCIFERVSTDPPPRPITPGPHQFRADGPGGVSLTKSFTVVPGRPVTIDFNLDPKAKPGAHFLDVSQR